MKQALVVQGGWQGHEPQLTSRRFAHLLENNGYHVTLSDTLGCFRRPGLSDEARSDRHLLDHGHDRPTIYQKHQPGRRGRHRTGPDAHGGMCDAFRNDTEWQFMTGGQWVSHPGGDGIRYTVNICKGSSPIVEGLEDFEVSSEHYYLHVDPAIEILATTRFPIVPYYHIANKPVDMPVAWTKYWGLGRVFYLSLGHHDDVFDKAPTAQTLMERGMLWAGDGKEYALQHQLTTAPFENTAKMY